MSEINTEIVVIGSGSAGLTAAIGLSKIGYKVIIIEKEYIGGDCTHFGCVPSKALLSRAKKFKEFNNYNKKLDIKVDKEVLKNEADTVLEATRNVVWEFSQHESREWLEGYGIKVIFGEAAFEDKDTIKIINPEIEKSSPSLNLKNSTKLKFKKTIICSGSTTYIPPIQGLSDDVDGINNTIPFLTNKNIFKLKSVPKSIAIIGNGPIGVELSEAFSNLGSSVSLIGNSDQILPRSEYFLAEKLQKKLEQNDFQYLNKKTKEIQFNSNKYSIIFEDGSSLESDNLLIATGRKPNLIKGLDKAGVEYSSRGIKSNKSGKTTNSHIFVAGDVAQGYPNFTHFAGHMGGVITTNLAIEKYTKLPLHFSKFNTKAIPAITFTAPELAECGLTEKLAKEKYGDNKIKSFTFNFKDLDRAKAQGHEEGYIKIVTKGFFGNIVGVHILASRAGEILPELQRMVQKQSSIFSLSKIIRAYPSYTANLDSLFKEWLVKKISK